MRVVQETMSILTGLSQGLSNFVCVFSQDGRRILLQRAALATAKQQLEVLQLERRIAVEEANATVDLIQKAERIKDPQLREKMEREILSIGRASPSVDRISTSLSDEKTNTFALKSVRAIATKDKAS